MTVGGNTNITDLSGGTTIGNLETTGTTTITSTNADITQANGTTIKSTGTTTLNAGTADITLAEATNDFSTLIASGDDVTIKDANNIELGATTATGTLNIITNNGDITQTNGSAIVVDGIATLNSGTGDITLESATNNFKDRVNLTGNDIAIKDGIGGIELGTVTATTNGADSGDLTVTSSGGDITQTVGTTIYSNGVTTLSAGNDDIILNEVTNDFNTLKASGNDVSIKDANNIELGTTTTRGTLSITTNNGDITQTNGSTITAAGTTTLNAGTGDITFGEATNDFQTVVTTGTNVRVINKNNTPSTSSSSTSSSDASVERTPQIKVINTEPVNVDANAGLGDIGNSGMTLSTIVSSGAATSKQGGNDKNSAQQNNLADTNQAVSFDGITVGTTNTGSDVKAIIIHGSASSDIPVTMLVPVNSSEGLSFTIPKNVINQVSQNSEQGNQIVRATLSDGTDLPSWITFDMETRSFTSSNVPLDGLPLVVKVLTISGKSIEVVLKNK